MYCTDALPRHNNSGNSNNRKGTIFSSVSHIHTNASQSTSLDLERSHIEKKNQLNRGHPVLPNSTQTDILPYCPCCTHCTVHAYLR
ncbi:hypothetical protein VTN00DRAFT_7275 [Thermoascus crustaceus]|uniref:uncharacterized protein n=1 Tax=Thermoascus crustaceus TaxID=5088 RepID=UPI003744385A